MPGFHKAKVSGSVRVTAALCGQDLGVGGIAGSRVHPFLHVPSQHGRGLDCDSSNALVGSRLSVDSVDCEAVLEYDSGQQAPGVASGQLMARLSTSALPPPLPLLHPLPLGCLVFFVVFSCFLVFWLLVRFVEAASTAGRSACQSVSGSVSVSRSGAGACRSNPPL